MEKSSSPCITSVFSSRSRQWELRSFGEEGDVVGTVANITRLPRLPRFAVYWRGALYVQRGANFILRWYQQCLVIIFCHLSSFSAIFFYQFFWAVPWFCRISLSANKYHVIRPPVGVRVSMHSTRYLDRSENGVYFAALDRYHLRVWIIDESFGQMEWMLKVDKDLEHVLSPHRQVHGRWMLTTTYIVPILQNTRRTM
jgi:hypothetical protein